MHPLEKPGIRTAKLQLAFDALNFADGRVSEAKRIIAERGLRISSRTWAKAISARIACSPVPVLDDPFALRF